MLNQQDQLLNQPGKILAKSFLNKLPTSNVIDEGQPEGTLVTTETTLGLLTGLGNK
jgi:hypothetical protein